METTETTFNTEFIDNIVEEQPFLDSVTRGALEAWFDANGLKPVFEDRNVYERREELLDEEPKNKGLGHSILYLPIDLNLSEMKGIVRNLSTQGVEKIEKLAETFKKVGGYIYENRDCIQDGKDIAGELSKKFFNYGLFLDGETMKQGEPIPLMVLNESEKRELDKWLVGKERYYKVMSRLGSNPSQEDIDKERKRGFHGYFKALSSRGFKGDSDKPWERSLGPVARIQEQVKEGIERELRKPETVLYESVGSSGAKKLIEEMKIPLATKDILEKVDGGNLKIEHERLYDYLEIPKLKQELAELRTRGNIKEISEKEYEIAKKIREEIYRYQYGKFVVNPSEVVTSDYVNCVSGTLLGISLLDEIGIKYLYVSSSAHVMTFLETSDRKLYWQSFTSEKDYQNGKEVTGDMFEGNPDILMLANNFDSFNIYLKSLSMYLNVSSSPEAKMSALMRNLASILGDLGEYEQAVKILRKALELTPNRYDLYNNLAVLLCECGREEESIEIFKKGIELNPDYFWLYINLGKSLSRLGREKEAREVVHEAFVDIFSAIK